MPRKIILYIAMSLDGYIARKDGSIDWLESDIDFGFDRFNDSIDTVLVGRKTYNQCLGFDEYPFTGKKCYVYTSKPIDDNHGAIAVNKFNTASINEFLAVQGKNIWLVGGGELIKHFYSNNLIDEYIITVLPVILGDGIPLFYRGINEINLDCISVRRFPNGFVELIFRKLTQY